MSRLPRSWIRSLGPTWSGEWLRDNVFPLLAQILVTASTTALSVLLARGLGPAEWGLFSALLGVSQGLALVVQLGLPTYIYRELSQLEEDARRERRDGVEGWRTSEILSAALAASLAIGIPLTFAAAVISAVAGLRFSLTALFAGLLAYVALLACAYVLEARLRSQRRLHSVLAVTFVEKAALLVCVGASLQLDLGFGALGASHAIAGAARLAAVSVSSVRDRA